MRITLLILGSFFSTYTVADIYKCTDANGKTDYQSSPCDVDHKTEQINIKTGSSTEVEHKTEGPSEQELQEKQEQELLEKKQAQLKQDAINESAKNQFLIKNNPEKFSAFSIPPYAPDELPDLVINYQARLPDIERLRRLAAEKALATATCGRVEASELHSKSTKQALVFLVSCSSGKSFYFTEQELGGN
ncbi:MAG: DUF4124 domain-containing protein [Methylobacter sp.]